jgi:acyl carrier protein
MPETVAADANADASARRLLALIEDLVAETRSRRRVDVGLDDSLERELGLDSLARVELLLRTERAFDVSLPDHLLNSIETPRDLLRSVLAASGAPAAIADHNIKILATGGEQRAPQAATTLLEVLDWHVAQHPSQLHIHLYGEDDKERPITYAELAAGARSVAAQLLERGLEPGNAVAIMLPTGADYFFVFFGILAAGGVPVPIYPPTRLAQIEDHLRRHAAILANAQARILVTVPEARSVALLLRAQIESLKSVVTAGDLVGGGRLTQPSRSGAQDIAFLQYTSGSTGNPKGVVLTHANLLANIRAMGEVVAPDANDVFVSWLPLYHDMGLIGAWFCSLYFGFPLAIMSPLAFLARPQRWLWAIHRHRGTLSAAPNFAYELCVRKIADRDLEGLDLSSWRCAFNGAEPVSPDTLAAFQRRFAPYGLRSEAITPVYGLAESSVGLCLPRPGRGAVVDNVQREPFTASGQALPALADDPQALRFVGCGVPLPGHQVRIVGGTGFELGERQVGRLQFKGPSATSGYYRNAEDTRKLFVGDWLDSGDYAYVAAGEAYLAGRAKDMIIRGGRNLYPYELEQAVGNIAGIRRGCVAVFGSREPESGTERLVVLAETRETDPERQQALRRAVNDCAIDLLGMPADDVVLVRPHTVLKTSSGKIRRAASREFYERGGKAARPAPVWWQFVRLAWTSAVPQLRRWQGAAGAWGYVAYAWLVFWLLAPAVWLAVAATASPERSRRLIHGAARLLLRLMRTPLLVSGLENLPHTPCVLAANHTSYLDGILLAAALPPDYPYSFVAKREFLDHFVARLFLQGIGCVFVERFDARQGVEHAGQVAEALQEGRMLVFFPEGTFDRRPGVRPFRSGAFSVAVRAGASLVPVAIRGARSMLRENDWFPYRGAASIAIGTAIRPSGSEWRDVVELRDRVRAEILKHSGEPDLEG